jgi:DNA-binding LacI/PurR family transcriptional regulator
VSYDNYDAGQQAAEHLIENGCRRILYYSSRSAYWVTMRLDGVHSAIAASRRDISLECYISDQAMPETGLDQVQDAHDQALPLFGRYPDVDGVIAANDNFAIGYLRAARSRGLSAPENYLLIGFDDNPNVTTMAGITSMRRPLEQMASEAASLALRGLTGESYAVHIACYSQLILRNTTSKRRGR